MPSPAWTGFTGGIAAGVRIFACFFFEELALKYRRNSFSFAFVLATEWKELLFFK